MPRLILLRHGESLWNRQERFSGWGDPPLSGEGVRQALEAGRRLAAWAARPDAVFCSALVRARQTLELALWAAGAAPPETAISWRLNERHCGRWEGRIKREVTGAGLAAWRERDQTRPPLLAPGDPRHPRHDARYRGLPAALLPDGESHLDLRVRLEPLWREIICPRLRARRCVWVVAHSGSLRALAEMAASPGPEMPLPRSFPPAEPFQMALASEMAILRMGFLDGREAAN
ncbi:MAG: 2,3-bisphosphoglycerate-dependent phosphoglycerate mutase [Thermodesulfobacteriota bacterium]